MPLKTTQEQSQSISKAVNELEKLLGGIKEDQGLMEEIVKREDALFEQVSKLIDEARKQVRTAVNTAMVYTYYGVGRYIVEDEQQGQERAEYGKTVLKKLSERLTKRYGNGWSAETLDKCRKFYRVYSDIGISSTLLTKLDKGHTIDSKFALSWSHYLVLMRIEEERLFYILYANRERLKAKEMQRCITNDTYSSLLGSKKSM